MEHWNLPSCFNTTCAAYMWLLLPTVHLWNFCFVCLCNKNWISQFASQGQLSPSLGHILVILGMFVCYIWVISLVPRLSITANAVEGLVKLLCRMTSGGCREAWLTRRSTAVYRKCHGFHRPPDVILHRSFTHRISCDWRPGNEAMGDYTTLVSASLVPRLPRSGTRTLKLCRRKEPGIFSHMSSLKGRKGIERP